MLPKEEDWDYVEYPEAEEEVPGDENKLLTDEDALLISGPEKPLSSNPTVSKTETPSSTRGTPLDGSTSSPPLSPASRPSLPEPVGIKARGSCNHRVPAFATPTRYGRSNTTTAGRWYIVNPLRAPLSRGPVKNARHRFRPRVITCDRGRPYRPRPEILEKIALQNPIPTRPDEVWVSKRGPASQRMRNLLRGIPAPAPSPTPKLEETTFKAGMLDGIWVGEGWVRWARQELNSKRE
jgi:hypothetical protein